MRRAGSRCSPSTSRCVGAVTAPAGLDELERALDDAAAALAAATTRAVAAAREHRRAADAAAAAGPDVVASAPT